VTIRTVILEGALLVAVSPVFYRQPALGAKPEGPADNERAESAKRLAEIDKATDDTKRKDLLERYIREYPKASNIETAYSRLLGVTYKLDPARTISLADEILARPRAEKSTLWKWAYTYKFLALRKQTAELGSKVLDTESDPGLLQTAAEHDREHSSQLLEKAITERRKNPGLETDPDPYLDELHLTYSRKLNEQGKKDEAVQHAALAIELGSARLAELEALPRDDPKRRRAEGLRVALARAYMNLASLRFEIGAPDKGLEALGESEKLLEGLSAARALRPSLEETRGKIQAGMHKTEEALESYARAYALQMSPAIRARIREIASNSAKPADVWFNRARELRDASAEPFSGFELNTCDGKPASFAALKGKATLVNFFFPM
jgi:tetratricopeptide (TPR) repeat protein